MNEMGSGRLKRKTAASHATGHRAAGILPGELAGPSARRCTIWPLTAEVLVFKKKAARSLVWQESYRDGVVSQGS